MVRFPPGWPAVARRAGSLPATGGMSRRIPSPGIHLYVHPVTVDLGNDGMAPQVVFPASGAVQAFVGPQNSGESWSLDQCSVSTSIGPLDAAECVVFAGPQPLPQFQLAPSLSGGGQQFGLGGVAVPNGWFVWALWSGGTAGAVAYLRVTGVKTVLTA
jgi:hypothetical protein